MHNITLHHSDRVFFLGAALKGCNEIHVNNSILQNQKYLSRNTLRRLWWSKHHDYIKSLLALHGIFNYLITEGSVELLHLFEQSMNFPNEMPWSNLTCVFLSLNKDVWVSSYLDQILILFTFRLLACRYTSMYWEQQRGINHYPSTHLVLFDGGGRGVRNEGGKLNLGKRNMLL